MACAKVTDGRTVGADRLEAATSLKLLPVSINCVSLVVEVATVFMGALSLAAILDDARRLATRRELGYSWRSLTQDDM